MTNKYCVYCGNECDEDQTYCCEECADNDQAELQEEIDYQNAIYYGRY